MGFIPGKWDPYPGEDELGTQENKKTLANKEVADVEMLLL